jgi:hypothetical protein
MGSGSTLAAAESIGYESIGIEMDPDFYFMSVRSIPGLAVLFVAWQSFEGPNGHQTGHGSSHPSQSELTATLPINDSKIAK